MIGSETPILLAKASEIFVEELTLNAWKHTEDNKRKTLQKSDISQAVARYSLCPFLATSHFFVFVYVVILGFVF